MALVESKLGTSLPNKSFSGTLNGLTAPPAPPVISVPTLPPTPLPLVELPQPGISTVISVFLGSVVEASGNEGSAFPAGGT
jgi:hypothetical protein